MFKKKILFIFIIMFVFMFIDIKGVRAISGLYCIYDDGAVSAPYTMLVQDSSGGCSVYERNLLGTTDDYISYDTFGWELKSNYCMNSGDEYYYIPSAVDMSSGSAKYIGFSKCPAYYNKLSTKQFSDSKSDGLDYGLIANGSFSGKSDGLQIALMGDINSYKIDENNYSFDNFKKQWVLNPESDGYTQSCLYSSGNSNDNFGTIQMDINFQNKKVRISGVSYVQGSFSKLNSFHTNYSFSTIEKYYNGTCPLELYATYEAAHNNPTDYNMLFFSNINKPSSLNLLGASKNLLSYNLTNSSPKVDFSKINIKKNTVTIENCNDIFGEELLKILHDAVNLVKILVPLILIALGIVDFAKAVFGSKEDDMKKSASRFIKRVIIAIVIFFIPSFLNVILTIAHSIWGNIDPSLCGII